MTLPLSCLPPALDHAASCPSSRERRRVHDHIARAERGAHARGPIGGLRGKVRALLLDELKRYRERGRFPRNPGADQRRPVFIDAAGTRCAMAHLLEVGGEVELAQRIARDRNFATVHELADEPRLVAWLAAAGLTLDEAAAIQPTYTTSDLFQCVCGYNSILNRSQGSQVPPSPTVLDVRVVGPVTNPPAQAAGAHFARGEVTAIYGRAGGYVVGQSVDVFTNADDRALAPDARVLVPEGSPGTADPRAFGIPFVVGIGVQDDGMVRCSMEKFMLTPEDVIEALQTRDCVGLVWNRRTTEAPPRRDAGPPLARDAATPAIDAGSTSADASRPAEDATASTVAAPRGCQSAPGALHAAPTALTILAVILAGRARRAARTHSRRLPGAPSQRGRVQ